MFTQRNLLFLMLAFSIWCGVILEAKAAYTEYTSLAAFKAANPDSLGCYYALLNTGDGQTGYFAYKATSGQGDGGNSAGTCFTTANGALWERVRLSPTLNVKWFGAKGDGITDDRAAIQAAIDANTSYLKVGFPEGTYLLNGSIIIDRQNLYLQGKGRSTTIYPTAGIIAFRVAESNGVSHLDIRDMRFYGGTNAAGAISLGAGGFVAFCSIDNVSVENFSAVGSYGIKLCKVQELDINNPYMVQNYRAIYGAAGTGNYITSTHIHGQKGRIGQSGNLGILIEMPAASFLLSDIVIENNTAGGCAFIGKGTQVNIRNVHFECNLGANTIYVAGTAAGRAKFSIDSCFFYGNAQPILRLDYVIDSKVANNFGLIAAGNVVLGTDCAVFFELNRSEDVAMGQDPVAFYDSFATSGNVSFFDVDANGVQVTRMNGCKLTHRTSVPTTGAWSRGDRVINKTPSVGSPKSWVCTAQGTPGTWRSEGNL